MSTMRSPCQSTVSRPVAFTSPITTASTSHLAQRSMNSTRRSGRTIAHIRSCDSLIKISSGDKVSSRKSTRSSQTCMPPSPFEASSLVAHEMPAPPRSWIPSTSPACSTSRVASISNFSMKGSPTCTLGRLVGPPSLKVSEARTETPPMPSPPVRAPYRTTKFPTPFALARWISSCFIAPTHNAFTSGLPLYEASKTISPPIFGRPKQLP